MLGAAIGHDGVDVASGCDLVDFLPRHHLQGDARHAKGRGLVVVKDQLELLTVVQALQTADQFTLGRSQGASSESVHAVAAVKDVHES